LTVLRALVAVAACAVVAGCASSPTPSGPTAISPPPPSGSPAPAEHGTFARCLHEHGVQDGSGSVVLRPPPGVDQNTWDTAVQACATLAPGPAS